MQDKKIAEYVYDSLISTPPFARIDKDCREQGDKLIADKAALWNHNADTKKSKEELDKCILHSTTLSTTIYSYLFSRRAQDMQRLSRHS